MKLIFVFISASIGLTGQQDAAPAKPALDSTVATSAARPPNADGDMGCYIAFGTIETKAGKSLNAGKLSELNRHALSAVFKMVTRDLSWYTGRVSSLPPERRNKAAFHAAYVRMEKRGIDQTYGDAMACSQWATDINSAMLSIWSTK